MSAQDFKNRPFKQRLGFALAGFKQAWQQEHSFRTQVVMAVLTITVFAIIGLTPLWWALILLCIGLVLAAELLNSAIETLIDHLHPQSHPAIGKVKDMLAAMVLMLSIMSVVLACLAVLSRFI
ncbi:diacylglycerol kinase [Psychromonas ingrahamii 37]|uniref:Diacylglycerol kinase n=1 Tax=Psychromonas ingrahamii (strain DSM 17664 / CCUG 51855 / 37) TaxID=357804 RepID=A1SVI4_PSYIN|nr:diacylglycerol kinase [Psychromonas ingrahamii]ABM03499.1 diacylglycerol kinase [Psychromonas ingrahamii 37]